MIKALKILGFILLLITIIVGATALYFSYQIRPILITEINKSLAVEVNVKDIRLSSVASFPKLGLTLKEVKIAESTTHFDAYLLEAEELNLFIDVWKIYKGEYVIDAITLKSGELNVADLKTGTNYNILKPSADTEDSEVGFEIKTLEIVDCNLKYEHKPSNYKTNCYIPSSTIAVKYEGSLTLLDVDAQMDKTMLIYGQDTFVSNKDVVIKSDIEINTQKELVLIAPSSLKIEKINLSVKGEISYAKNSYVDILFGNDAAPANRIISVLPTNIISITDGFTLSGDIKLDGYFKGETYGNKPLAFGFNYITENLDLQIDEKDIALKNIVSNGKLNIDNLDDLSTGKASCTIQSTTENTGSIYGRFLLDNFSKPRISWEGETDLAIKFLHGMTGDNNFQVNSGRLITNGSLKLTYLPPERTLAYNSLLYNGSANLKNVSGRFNNQDINLKSLNLNLNASENDLLINDAKFDYNDTRGSISGILIDYRSLFNKYPNATLTGKLDVDGLNISELLYEDSTSKNASSSSEDITPIKLDLETRLTNFTYNDFKAKQLSGKLLCDRKELQIPKCNIIALEGNTMASLKLKKWGENYLLDVNSELENINISELFKQFNNFEQSEITDQHLSGTLSGNIIAKVILDGNYSPILPKLYAKAKVKVNDGALINYEPLQELSSFVNIDDLRNVKFKTLENEIEIFDQTIFIPSMSIQNNALNLEIEGTHTFENYMRYNMGLSVAELLANKAKWIAKKNEKRIEKNGSGGLTAYIIMEGTPDDLKIKYDRATVKENVKQEVKKEKTKFLNALKGEGSLNADAAKNKDYDDVWDE